MSVFKRRMLFIGIGALAGLAAWPAAEVTVFYQMSFPSYLAFSVVLGAVFGALMGGCFGSGESIVAGRGHRTLTSGPVLARAAGGALMGALGGLAGCFSGQALLFFVGEVLLKMGRYPGDFWLFPFARAVGWAILGAFVGIAVSDALMRRSKERLRTGLIGGGAGGFLGGLILEYLQLGIPGLAPARLAGLIVFGACLGFVYGAVEARFAYGVLTLLNGRRRGREFLISRQRLSLGSASSNDIVLDGYAGVASKHAVLEVHGEDVAIRTPRRKTESPRVYANDDRIEKEHVLKIDDVVRIGKAKLIFHY